MLLRNVPRLSHGVLRVGVREVQGVRMVTERLTAPEGRSGRDDGGVGESLMPRRER